MEPKYLKIFSKSAESYCKLNNIEDVDGFIKKCFDTGFNIQKYGLLGKTGIETWRILYVGLCRFP